MCLRLVRFKNLMDGADFAYADDRGQHRLGIKCTDQTFTNGRHVSVDVSVDASVLKQRVVADDSWIKVLEAPRRVF